VNARQAVIQGPAEVSGLYAEARALNLRVRQADVPDLRFAASREMAWQDRGRCAEVGVTAFYPGDGESAAPALRVCAACEVRGACLEFAMASDELWGVWGGTTERQRQRMRAARAREEKGLAA
jgi:WhiB family transcriptional regulator, redox-sensing transcriptional regulator